MALFAGFAVCAGVAGAAQLDGNFDALSCQLLVLSNFYHDCTLNPLFLQFTANIICIINVSMEMIGVCCTSAAAVEPCKALAALLLGINVAFFEFVDSFCLFHAFVNISEAEIFLSYELDRKSVV